jgi:HSP20 family molecular chaperone IbpA
MLPATWIERLPDVPFLGRLRAWLEPGRPPIPVFGEISFGLWRPTLDVCEAVEEFVIRVDLPGLAPEQIRVRCESGILTIAGTRDEIREVEEIDFPLRERVHGSFSRSIRLPAEADETDVRTTVSHGLLTVRVGKRPAGSSFGGWTHRSVY